MTRDGLLDAYRNQLLTETELYASLTALLSEDPEELEATRGALAFDARVLAGFEAWLEDLKSYPLVVRGNQRVAVSRELVSRLGPPVIPPAGELLRMARVRFTVPAAERPSGVFAAQVKTPADGDEIPHGQHRVVVQPLSELEFDAGTDVAAAISPSSAGARSDVLLGDVELFQGTTRIAIASIAPPRPKVVIRRRPTRDDYDFLAEAQV